MNINQSAGNPDQHAVYRIGAVSRLTNIPTETLRVWERRYKVVEPSRTPGGNRVYEQHDVARLEIIKMLVDNGHAISTVANLPLNALQERLKEIQMAGHHMVAGEGEKQQLVIIGQTLPQSLGKGEGGFNDHRPDILELVGIYPDVSAYLKDPEREQADTVIVEYATLNDDAFSQVDLLRSPRIIIVYGFSPPELIRKFESKGCILLRAPVSWRVLTPICYAGVTMKQGHADGDAQEPLLDSEPPKKKFTDRQLAHYLAISSTVRCECPKHVAELIIHLNRFEKYSAECENRNEEDALLHSYLRTMTARSRSIMEKALIRLSEIEKIPFVDPES
jgi:DNA-binding transcriptional MerR regulator